MRDEEYVGTIPPDRMIRRSRLAALMDITVREFQRKWQRYCKPTVSCNDPWIWTNDLIEGMRREQCDTTRTRSGSRC